MIIELLKTTLFILFFVVITLSVGQKVLALFGELDEDYELKYSISYLLGLAIFTYGLIILGLLGLFNLLPIIIYLVIWIMISLPNSLANITKIKDWLLNYKKHIAKVFGKKYWLILVIVFLAITNYLACFAPPSAWDEVAYHLPEANDIITKARIVFPVNGHPFYGNLPVSMEVLYAFSIKIIGYSLTHVMHFTFFLSLLFAIFSFLKKRYGLLSGLLACILIFLLSEFMGNATSGYIDVASTTFEVIGLFFIIGWIENKKDNYLYLSGLFYGFSLNVKYTAFYSLAVIAFVTGVVTIVSKQYSFRVFLKKTIAFLFFVFLGGGFWYIKNWILYGNPLYPYFFGHPGISDASLKEIDGLVKSFLVPRTLISFIKIPYTFFFVKMSSLQDIIVPVALILAPFALFCKKGRRSTIILLSVSFISLILWFFAITHQTRFLFSTIVIVVMLAAIALEQLKLANYKVVILVIIALTFFQCTTPFLPMSLMVKSINTNILKRDEVNLIFGKTSKVEYLASRTNDFIYITDYLNSHYSNKNVINYWNHNSYFYLENGNKYLTDVPSDSSQYDNFIKENDIKLLAIDGKMEIDFLVNPSWEIWRSPRIPFEKYLINHGKIVYRKGECKLYEIK